MSNIKILDCTLRDGGYVNDFDFGKKNISAIISNLSKAAIDIIECGFLVSGENDVNKTLFGSTEKIKSIINEKSKNSIYVAMIQYGKISGEEISPRDDLSIDGIRVTFHEHEIDGAFILGRQLIEKGYKVFMQPVGTTTYSRQALINLIEKVNELNPYAFYLVDTLGTMYKKDLLNMFNLVNESLNENIAIGFHSHNNLQLAFSNAQELIEINAKRVIIIDSSVYGMGRGAGNLNTELLTQYINDNVENKYNNFEILKIMDDIIKPIQASYKWGYDAPFYLSAIVKCHPNYASFLINKKTLTINDMNVILSGLAEEKKSLFDRDYIENVYKNYLSRNIDDSSAILKIKEIINNRDVVIIAPGKSILFAQEKIRKLKNKNNCIISLNFNSSRIIKPDMLFITNRKRFEEISHNSIKDINIVATSNIDSNDDILKINYDSYLNNSRFVSDNTGLMIIELLRRVGVKKIYLVGFDGFDYNVKENYYDKDMINCIDKETIDNMNVAIKDKIQYYSKFINISFITESLYE